MAVDVEPRVLLGSKVARQQQAGALQLRVAPQFLALRFAHAVAFVHTDGQATFQAAVRATPVPPYRVLLESLSVVTLIRLRVIDQTFPTD